MIYKLLRTDADYITLFLRVIAGIIISPYGMQKLFGWFYNLAGGVGIKETLIQMNTKKIPTAIAFGIYGMFIYFCFGFDYFTVDNEYRANTCKLYLIRS